MTSDRAASPARRLMLLGAVGLALSACAGRPPVLYVLGTPSPAAESAQPLTGRPVIEVQRVLMPDYLDVTDILIRRPGNVMDPSATGRWGERLSVGFRRALADDLARDLPGFTVTTQRLTDPSFRQVLTEVETFEARPDGQVVLSARWRLTDSNGDRQLAGEHVSLTEQAASTGDAAIVAAMSRAIERLAQVIVTAVDRTGSRGKSARR
jgi:uncharacterized lipoprotein YmbA